ncbi:MAG TPA: arabinan endo-1,5-alpha-L-arabinosidase [Verrucomicrobiae bacterium]|jgi:arabinan endo-1,5-alpha-L-arabinosidase
MRSTWLNLIAVIVTVLAAAPASAAPESPLFTLGRRDIACHDPSTIVKCKDEYWVFGTGRGLLARHSTNLIDWMAGQRIFKTPPAWTTNAIHGNNGAFWAPDVTYLGNRYLLYYAVSTWGKRTSAIGLATNATLDPADPAFAWKDEGLVIQTSDANNYNAIDPAIVPDADGKLWLAFGSYWSGIKLVELDPATGRRVAADSPIYSLAWNDSIEASYIYHHDGYYYLFVNWGQCCRGVKSTYNIRIGRSQKITGPYLDKKGVDMLKGGGTVFLETSGSFIGPGHAGIITAGGKDWLSCHYYDATQDGRGSLGILPLTWDAAGWPEVVVPNP